ncbi:hypothetical protein G9A89_002134 [Geosiphon pyriformis]|nr:hypothetical protein G9A89_002134 [Geosiphon pyriformis]
MNNINHTATTITNTERHLNISNKIVQTISSSKSFELTKRRKESPNVLLARNGNDDFKIPVNQIEVLEKYKRYAYYAMKAYCIPELDKIGPGIHASIKIKNEGIVLTIRSSVKLNQLQWSSFPLQMIPYRRVKGAKVNKNFYEDFLGTGLRISKRIIKLIQASGIKKVFAFGHGVGGVYAIFALLELMNLQKGLYLSAVTFGQPRIGNQLFAKYINDNIINLNVIRVTHSDDFVPTMPPSTISNIYEHNKLEMFINKNCDCDQEEVFWCPGPEIQMPNNEYFMKESQHCNQKFSRLESKSNNGPYFTIKMGSCLDQDRPY